MVRKSLTRAESIHRAAAIRYADWQERFWSKVDKNGAGGCWLWTAPLSRHGYAGSFMHQGRAWQPHRLSYVLVKGPFPEDLTIDHLCRVKHCVNPDHLEPVPIGVNVRRSTNPAALNARKTHCKRGHPLSGDNLLPSKQGFRVCRACKLNRKPAGRPVPEYQQTAP